MTFALGFFNIEFEFGILNWAFGTWNGLRKNVEEEEEEEEEVEEEEEEVEEERKRKNVEEEEGGPKKKKKKKKKNHHVVDFGIRTKILIRSFKYGKDTYQFYARKNETNYYHTK